MPTLVDNRDVGLEDAADSWINNNSYTIVFAVEHVMIVFHVGTIILRILLGHSAQTDECHQQG